MRGVLGLRAGKVGVSVFVVFALLVPAVPVSADTLECGDVLTEDTVLEADLTCDDNGLFIGASGITLDLNGHTIFGRVNFSGVGIHVRDHDHVTVRNGTLDGFYAGVVLRNVSDSLVENVTVSENWGRGILLRSSSFNVVRRNDVSSTPGLLGTAVHLEQDSHHNSITSNRLNGDIAGVQMSGSSHNEVIDNFLDDCSFRLAHSDWNYMARNTISDSHEGMVIFNSDDNTISRNTITAPPNPLYGFGIRMGISDRNLIESNLITGSAGAGIEVRWGAADTEVTRNRLASNGTGIVVGDADQTIVSRNTVISSALDGIVIEVDSTGATLTRNRSFSNGTSSGPWDGIDVRAPGTTLAKNKAFFNIGYGISAVPEVIDGGGNKAKHNDAGQCLNITCK